MFVQEVSYQDYLAQRILKQADYLRERYGGACNAPQDEVQHLIDYVLDLANFGENRERCMALGSHEHTESRP